MDKKDAILKAALKLFVEQGEQSTSMKWIDVWLRAILYAISKPEEFKFLEAFSHSPKISSQANEEINALLFPILEIFEKGKKEGIIKDYDTIQLLMFTNGAITTSVIYNNNLDEQDKRNIILMAWDAIKS